MKIICKLFGHNFKFNGRSNGTFCGWNKLKCKHCNYESDTLTEF